MKLNINESIKARLTEYGREIIDRNYSELFKKLSIDLPIPHQPDADGYSTFQLWEFMRTFGEYMAAGIEPPFEMTIEIPEKRNAMKEILFRGISKETGEYVNGDLLMHYYNKETYSILPPGREPITEVYKYSVDQLDENGEWQNIGHGQKPNECCLKEKERLEKLIAEALKFSCITGTTLNCPICNKEIYISAVGTVRVSEG
jgi:hypothetical protein